MEIIDSDTFAECDTRCPERTCLQMGEIALVADAVQRGDDSPETEARVVRLALSCRVVQMQTHPDLALS